MSFSKRLRGYFAYLRDSRTDLAIPLAFAGLVFVFAHRLLVWLLGFVAPRWSEAVAQMNTGSRTLIGGAAAALFLIALFYRHWLRLQRQQWDGTGFIYTSPEHPSEAFIEEREAGGLFEKLRELREQIPVVPPGIGPDGMADLHFWDGRFDPNRWFAVFDRVRARPGYVVDFVYFFWGNGGRPLLYLRKERAKRLAACDNYWKRFGGDRANPVAWDNRALLKHLGFEPSAIGFLQFVTYLREAPRFHVHWHSHANDDEFVCTKRRLAAILGGIPERDEASSAPPDGVSAEERRKLSALDLRPRILLQGRAADVRLLSFTNFGGFSWEHYRVVWPSHVERVRTELVVPYHRPLHH